MIQKILTVGLIAFTVASTSARAQDCAAAAPFEGPIIITNGGTYSGNWQSPSVDAPAVQIFTAQPVTIVNSRLRGPGVLMNVGSRANVTVTDSCFVGTNPNVRGRPKGDAIHFFQPANVVVEHSDFESVGHFGIWVQQYLGDSSPNNSVRIRFNRIHNLDARASDGNGGYITSESSQNSHAIMLTNVNGVPAIDIGWNQIVNEPFRSAVGDSINIFDSSGTPGSPMHVHDNYIQGGWDSDLRNLDSTPYFGSAITTDGDFQTNPGLTTAFLKVHENQAVGFGNLGMGLALGHDIEMYANRVISSGQLADGTPSTTSFSFGFMYQNYRNNPAAVFGNNSVHDNFVGLRRRRASTWERADYAFLLPATVNSNNTSFASADGPKPADEAAEAALWVQKLARQRIALGPRGGGIPGAPSNLIATATGSTVTLTWGAPTGGAIPTGYVIEAGSVSAASDLANFPTGSAQTSFTATDVGVGTYYVRVRAATSAGAGPASPEARLQVGTACATPPAAPSALTNSISASTVTLVWNASPGATSYVVEAGSTTGSSNVAVAETGNPATTLVAPGVGAGVYFVRIRARNACGPSGPSNETIVHIQ